MAQNKNALIRYKTIDKCLQNKYRMWTLDDLIEACSDALYEYEGKENSVSKRTIQLDIQLMRSEKLGYNAPIEVYDKKYYRYADEDFSITDIPLTETDINVLTETVSMLKQFKDFSLFNDVSDILQRLEDKIYAEKTHTQPIIHLDKNENLKGLHFLDAIYQAIVKKVVLIITYKSFKSREAQTFNFHPFILKEFNNRWFVVGKKKGSQPISNLALDRIITIDYDFSIPYLDYSFDADAYYKNVVGVTVNKGMQACVIQLWVDAYNAPYVITKPIHTTQRIIQQNEDGSIIVNLFLKENFELERIILGFGASMKVLKPERLRKRMKFILEKALENYPSILA
ncbi:WYL domain-containing protein [Flavobacterium columnare NBRC 100251 = ATCC 23463]|uniref:WYL domain-containing protein n=1 Tax=Flavobacterium columnare TaxID=996 RepID=A0AAI8CHC3_9FLAO|nr:WYL domain-containing protein [Flavobacterium columnare]AMO20136.1 WYL domain-containing protein [Flavobacterium columnare]ANO49345.1 putative transcriptional regulator [Flavobacterium columnare]APT22682.1 WYL domain-containing protein [Flavobacterium columnare]AUX18087.1 transcriptional regulator [Flavobacterium columnare]MBF6651717.1 WYL domain-containing protein [Flavobacterium columnare]